MIAKKGEVTPDIRETRVRKGKSTRRCRRRVNRGRKRTKERFFLSKKGTSPKEDEQEKRKNHHK